MIVLYSLPAHPQSLPAPPQHLPAHPQPLPAHPQPLPLFNQRSSLRYPPPHATPYKLTPPQVPIHIQYN